MAQAAASSLVVFSCAASAGIHAGLVPEHLREEPRLGVAFMFAVAVLLITGAAVAFRPADRRVARLSVVLFGGLIAAYAASRTTGIPLLAPDPEAVDGVGVVAVAIEVAGLACALWLGQPIGRRRRRPFLREVTG